MPDDGEDLLKNKKVMKWDSTKKRYSLKTIDSTGRVIKDQRNEAGKKIKKKDLKKESAYDKWSKRTHLKLQDVGEMEDKKYTEQGKIATESRKMMKHFKSRHSDLNKGEDPRSNQALIESKASKLKERRKKEPKAERSRDRKSVV